MAEIDRDDELTVEELETAAGGNTEDFEDPTATGATIKPTNGSGCIDVNCAVRCGSGS